MGRFLREINITLLLVEELAENVHHYWTTVNVRLCRNPVDTCRLGALGALLFISTANTVADLSQENTQSFALEPRIT